MTENFQTLSCLRAFVPSCLRAFVPSCETKKEVDKPALVPKLGFMANSEILDP